MKVYPESAPDGMRRYDSFVAPKRLQKKRVSSLSGRRPTGLSFIRQCYGYGNTCIAATIRFLVDRSMGYMTSVNILLPFPAKRREERC